MSTQNELELKVQALLERVSTLTTDYENKVADLRVALTIASSDRDETREDRDRLQARLAELEQSVQANQTSDVSEA